MTEPAFDAVMAEVRAVLENADPVPPAVIAAAKGSFTWRTIDSELAELVADSADSLSAGSVGAGVRGETAPRLLTFEAAGLAVEVEVAESGASRHLVGQLVPMTSAEVVVRWNTGSASTTADDLGRFVVSDIPAGLVSLAVRRPTDASPVVTSWVSV
jgi:hypothetical protein